MCDNCKLPDMQMMTCCQIATRMYHAGRHNWQTATEGSGREGLELAMAEHHRTHHS
jgi:hypothetical protein